MKEDVIAVISSHHAVLKWLTERVTEAEPTPTRRLLLDEFAKALGGHQRAIDEAIIPALRAHGWRKVCSSLLVGHVDLKHRLGELLTLRPSSRAHQTALAALAVHLQAQLQRESGQLLPLLEEALDDWQRCLLGAEVREHLSLLCEPRRTDFAESEPAAGLLEEARLVLGSFPALQ